MLDRAHSLMSLYLPRMMSTVGWTRTTRKTGQLKTQYSIIFSPSRMQILSIHGGDINLRRITGLDYKLNARTGRISIISSFKHIWNGDFLGRESRLEEVISSGLSVVRSRSKVRIIISSILNLL
jgi:hypothetical protein